MDTSIIIVAVLIVIGAVAVYLQWASKSEEERRVFTAQLVKYAQMKLTDQRGKDRFAYVMAELQKRYPRVPVAWFATAIESALFDAKAQAGQMAPTAKPAPAPAPVEKQIDAPRWRN